MTMARVLKIKYFGNNNSGNPDRSGLNLVQMHSLVKGRERSGNLGRAFRVAILNLVKC